MEKGKGGERNGKKKEGKKECLTEKHRSPDDHFFNRKISTNLLGVDTKICRLGCRLRV